MTGDMLCAVCSEPAGEDSSQVCNNCERRFHLRLREDTDGKDCGEVWISEHYMSLEFACFTCLGAPPPAGAEPPVGRGH